MGCRKRSHIWEDMRNATLGTAGRRDGGDPKGSIWEGRGHFLSATFPPGSIYKQNRKHRPSSPFIREGWRSCPPPFPVPQLTCRKHPGTPMVTAMLLLLRLWFNGTGRGLRETRPPKGPAPGPPLATPRLADPGRLFSLGGGGCVAGMQLLGSDLSGRREHR